MSEISENQAKSLEEVNAELLPCPFCGGAPVMGEMRYSNTGNLYGYYLSCDGCGLERARAPACWTEGKRESTMRGAMVELADWWNTRAGPAARDALGEGERT